MQCQVLLWLDSKTVAPRKPILFDMANPQYKRYEVSLGLPGVPDIIVASGKRGDDTLITVQSKDSPTLTKQHTLAPQAAQGQTPQLDVVRNQLSTDVLLVLLVFLPLLEFMLFVFTAAHCGVRGAATQELLKLPLQIYEPLVLAHVLMMLLPIFKQQRLLH